MSMDHWWKGSNRKTKVPKPCPTTTLSITNPTQIGVGLGLCSEAVSNCLSHGMAAGMLSFVVWAVCLYYQLPTSPLMTGLHSSCWLVIVIIFCDGNLKLHSLLYVYYDNLLFTSPHIVSLEDLHNATCLKIVNLC